jgi:hypothetical protein
MPFIGAGWRSREDVAMISGTRTARRTFAWGSFHTFMNDWRCPLVAFMHCARQADVTDKAFTTVSLAGISPECLLAHAAPSRSVKLKAILLRFLILLG